MQGREVGRKMPPLPLKFRYASVLLNCSASARAMTPSSLMRLPAKNELRGEEARGRRRFRGA